MQTTETSAFQVRGAYRVFLFATLAIFDPSQKERTNAASERSSVWKYRPIQGILQSLLISTIVVRVNHCHPRYGCFLPGSVRSAHMLDG